MHLSKICRHRIITRTNKYQNKHWSQERWRRAPSSQWRTITQSHSQTKYDINRLIEFLVAPCPLSSSSSYQPVAINCWTGLPNWFPGWPVRFDEVVGPSDRWPSHTTLSHTWSYARFISDGYKCNKLFEKFSSVTAIINI